MKVKITHAGATVEADGPRVGWLRSVSLDAAAIRRDQIETGRVLIEIEGQEPTELMLPVAMIEMLLEGIGAGAPAPDPEPEGMAEEPALAAQDAGDDTEREDALMSVAAVRALIRKELGHHTSRMRAIDARDAEVRRAAARVNVDAAVGHWAQIALDAIVKASPSLADSTAKLAADARAGDAVAEGRLRERLRLVVDSTTAGGGSAMAPGKPQIPVRPKRQDARAPWERGIPNKPGEKN